MEVSEIKAVVGTNSRGSAAYEKMIRGESVGVEVLKSTFDCAKKKKKLRPLYELMEKIGDNHKLTVPQVAMSFCSSKGIVPVCGCRKPYQVEQLEAAVNIKLMDEEILQLEKEAERLNVKILGADIFRFAVRK